MSEAYFKDVNVLKGPLLTLLKKDGYQAVDMHYHSRYSVDGLAAIGQVISKCRKDAFGVALTDHNQINGAILAKKIAFDVFTIPGIEVTCHNGSHVLLHFYSIAELQEFFQKEMRNRLLANPWFINLDHEEVIDTASRYNCLITAPHPFGPGFIGIRRFNNSPSLIKKIHAIEAINGCCIGDMNTKAISWGKSLRKGFTGGSDGHCLAELGNVLTICKAGSVEEFLNKIKKKQSLVVGKEERMIEDAVNAVSKFVREEEKAPPKQLEEMWRDRGLLEWDYFKKKILEEPFLHHFHVHHQKSNEERLSEHHYTQHLKS